MKKIKQNVIMMCCLLSVCITKSQVPATLVCVDSVWYDTLNPNMINVSVFNGDTIDLYYPAVQIVSPTGDTISNVYNTVYYFAQLTNTFQTYTDTINVSGIADFSSYTFVMDEGFGDSTSIIQWCGPLGLEEIEINHLSVYPNPVCNLFSLADLPAGKKYFVSINDVSGRAVVEKLIYDTAEKIDVSSLSPGIYYLAVFNESKKQFLRFIKE